MLRPWTILDEEELAKSRIFRLYRDTARSPRTGETVTFSRIAAPHWVTVMPITEQGEVVLGSTVQPCFVDQDRADHRVHPEVPDIPEHRTQKEIGIRGPSLLLPELVQAQVESCAQEDEGRQLDGTATPRALGEEEIHEHDGGEADAQRHDRSKNVEIV